MTAPKLFISYSWSSPAHEERVLGLATELVDSGVNAILDKWDLREGHDAYAFMESMVTDSSVTKVLLICDRRYAERADGRSGGVGAEAQIISAELYGKQRQDKFVAIVFERDDQGDPCVPAYYRSRIHIDLSDPSRYAENFEKLLRWIFDKPLHEKPPLGERPAYLSEGPAQEPLATSAVARRAVVAVRDGRATAVPAMREYLERLSAELEKLRLDPDEAIPDEAVVRSVEGFLPYRNEAVEAVMACASYLEEGDVQSLLHGFFERCLPYLHRPANVTRWRDWDFDNFRFVIHELFVYSAAVLLQRGRLGALEHLLDAGYFDPNGGGMGEGRLLPFGAFQMVTESLTHRNTRLGLGRLSVRADLLRDRCTGLPIKFQEFMQADFVLYLRGEFRPGSGYGRWFPESLVWAGRFSGAFELFVRARSQVYFDRIAPILGVGSAEDIQELVEAIRVGTRRAPTWQHESLSVPSLVGASELCSQP